MEVSIDNYGISLPTNNLGNPSVVTFPKSLFSLGQNYNSVISSDLSLDSLIVRNTAKYNNMQYATSLTGSDTKTVFGLNQNTATVLQTTSYTGMCYWKPGSIFNGLDIYLDAVHHFRVNNATRFLYVSSFN